jgi:hypothetical protein
MKQIWKNAEKIGAIASLPIALIAIAISLTSNRTAKDAFDLSKQEFNSDRNLILTAIVNNDRKEIVLKPIDEGMVMQGCDIYYPSELQKGSWVVDQGDMSFSTLVAGQFLDQRLIESNTHDLDKHYFIYEGKLPVAIHSYYAARGSTFEDRSIYVLHYQSVISKESYPGKNIEFKNISFVGRLSDQVDIQVPLDEFWDNIKSEIISENMPNQAREATPNTANLSL